jgi:hypothetical protein
MLYTVTYPIRTSFRNAYNRARGWWHQQLAKIDVGNGQRRGYGRVALDQGYGAPVTGAGRVVAVQVAIDNALQHLGSAKDGWRLS